MSPWWPQPAAGLLLGLVVAYAAYRLKSLSRGGAVAAAALGTMIFGAGGWRWAIPVLAFFITSSVLSGLSKRGRPHAERLYAKGTTRDAGQVLGNGAIAGACVLTGAAVGPSQLPWVFFIGGLAAANADTWATEIGAFSRSLPTLITRPGKPVSPGTSGAVSPLGLSAALGGSALLAVLGGLLASADGYRTVIAGGIGGLVGSTFDSLLGATVQAQYRCSRDGEETEQHPRHNCGAQTVHVRGWPWLNNDWVNFACSAVGSLAAGLLAIGMGMR